MQAVEFLLKARDEASGALARVTGQVRGLNSAVGGISAVVGKAGAVGAAVAGLVALAGAAVAAGKALADTAEQLDRTSTATGVSVESLQVYKQVIEEGGGNAEGLSKAIVKLNRSIGEGNPLLAQLGITTKDTDAAFQQLVGILSRSQEMGKKSAVAFELLGHGSETLLGSIDALASGSEEMRGAMERAGAFMDRDAVDSALKLDKQLDELGRTWKGVVMDFQRLAVPVATVVLGAFSAIFNGAKALGGALRKAFVEPFEDLAKAAAEAETQYEKLEKAKAAARKIGGTVQVGVPIMEGVEVTATKKADVLAGVDLDKGGRGAVSEREKRIRSLMDLLHLTRRAAMQAVEALNAVEQAEKSVKEAGKLFEAGIEKFSPETQAAAYAQLPSYEAPAPRATGAAGGIADLLSGAVEVPNPWEGWLEDLPKVSEAMLDVSMKWYDITNAVTSGAAVVDASFEALWNGLQSGFAQVFSNLTSKGQTFRSAMRTIFQSLVSEVLAMLARIAAAAVFKFLLNLLAPGLGTFVGGLLGGSLSVVGLPATPTTEQAVTVNINAIDQRGIYESLTLPRGELRAAMRSVALAGAY